MVGLYLFGLRGILRTMPQLMLKINAKRNMKPLSLFLNLGFEFPDDENYFLEPIKESKKEEHDVSIDKRPKINRNWGKLKKYIDTMTRLKRNDAKKLEVAVMNTFL